jgi:hypothetical protein
MESCLTIGGEYRHGLGALLYKMGKISTLSRATTQNTTKTHNNQHEPPPPYPSAALALSLHGQAVGATNQWRHCFLSVSVPCKAPMVGFGGVMAGLPVWGAEKRRIKKQRDGRGSGLRWPPFDDGIQQST